VVVNIEHVSVGRASRVALERRHGGCRAWKSDLSFPDLEGEEQPARERWARQLHMNE
jgi:hypothetical protein